MGTPAANEIVLENQKPGNPKSEWDLTNGPSSSIEGYAAQFSVNKGETIDFKVNTPSSNYRLDIYRLGYYNGLGARKVATVEPTTFGSQHAPVTDAATGLVDAGNWTVRASWTVPGDATSGVYIAKLVREDGTAGENHIPFIVRNDTSNSDVLFQTSDTTWQAYNNWGGNSLYSGSPAGRAYKVSYNRPINTRFEGSPGQPVDFLFDSEYPTIRFLEANGYDVSYFSGIDSDRLGSEIREHKAFLSVGHDEYWSGQQRTNVEAARDAGVNLAFLSGNEVFWKTRWENSIAGTSTPYRTLVSYKETTAGANIDPSTQATGTWRDPRFETDAGRPEECAHRSDLYGERRQCPAVADHRTGGRRQAAALAQHGPRDDVDDPCLRASSPTNGTRNSTTAPGRLALFGSRRPSIRVPFSFRTTAPPMLLDPQPTVFRCTGPAVEHSVFGAGTARWGWGLDSVHDGSSPTDSRIQQATVNLLADMGVQPDHVEFEPHARHEVDRYNQAVLDDHLAHRAGAPFSPAPP